MPTSELPFPTPLTGDPNEVANALEAGGAEWGRGDRREAVRWLHRAADAAEAAGTIDARWGSRVWRRI